MANLIYITLYLHVCIYRRERGFCRICWTATANGDFEVSAAITDMAAGGGMFSSLVLLN